MCLRHGSCIETASFSIWSWRFGNGDAYHGFRMSPKSNCESEKLRSHRARKLQLRLYFLKSFLTVSLRVKGLKPLCSNVNFYTFPIKVPSVKQRFQLTFRQHNYEYDPSNFIKTYKFIISTLFECNFLYLPNKGTFSQTEISTNFSTA